MRDVASKGPVTRYFAKGLTADTIGGYDAQSINSSVHRSPILRSANIKAMDAAYDGLKSTINVMVNMTDGLPWPLKAAPQTFLYILQLFEVRVLGCCGTFWDRKTDLGDKSCQSVRPKITSLLFAVQTLWKAVERVSPEVVADNADLRKQLSEFFECVLTGSKCANMD